MSKINDLDVLTGIVETHKLENDEKYKYPDFMDICIFQNETEENLYFEETTYEWYWDHDMLVSD